MSSLAIVWLLGAACSAPFGPDTRLDFEQEGLANTWSASGAIQASRRPVPEAAGEGGPAGHGVELRAGAGTTLYTKNGVVVPDWRSFEGVSFWVYRDTDEVEARPTVTIEMQLYESDGRARFWRRVLLDRAGWTQVVVDLRWCSWGGGRIPRWDAIARLALHFRDETHLWIDSIEIVDEEDGPGARVPLEELGETVFSGRAALRFHADDAIEILTDAAALDLAAVSSHLAAVRASVDHDLPFLDPPAERPRVLVFAQDEDYRAFPGRLAERLVRSAAPPAGDGFTLMGIAGTVYDPAQGNVRPTLTHEFVHALLSRCIAIDNSTEWLHEGFANHFQLRFHPQASVASIVRRGISDPSRRLPLARLCDGKPIPTRAYWQAATLVRMLIEDAAFSSHLAELLAGMRAAGSTALEPHLETLGVEGFDELTERWIEFCASRSFP